MALLIIALDVVIIVVIVARHEIAVIGEDISAFRLILRHDVGAHMGVLNVTLFLLLLLFILLLQRLSQIFLVKVLMRC